MSKKAKTAFILYKKQLKNNFLKNLIVCIKKKFTTMYLDKLSSRFGLKIVSYVKN